VPVWDGDGPRPHPFNLRFCKHLRSQISKSQISDLKSHNLRISGFQISNLQSPPAVALASSGRSNSHLDSPRPTTTFTINQALPWGRSFDEYSRMFALTEHDLSRRIVGCADGPASFNAEMAGRGHRVISCDPLYQFTADEIRQRIDATYPEVVEAARRDQALFVWDTIKSPDDLGRLRMSAMERFLADYEHGRQEGRYIIAALPHLPFPDASFDLALCSHFLFLYSEEFPLPFHLDGVLEMARIAREARIFPLLDRAGRRSSHLDPVIETLRRRGFTASIERVSYEFQRGGNEMLRIAHY
jgi:hypothetical protein